MIRSAVNARWSLAGRTPRRALPAARRAFTLIELLTVVAVIVMVTMISVPAVRAMTRSNSRAQATAQIRAALSEARGVALARHAPAGLVIFEETAAHSTAVHGHQTAMQIFVEDYNQAQYTHHPHNTIFVPLSPARSYLPAGIAVAVLNDDLARGVMTGDETDSNVGKTRAVLFDASGQMIVRHGLARPNYTQLDWNFASQGTPPVNGHGGSDSSSKGISSPGFMLYDKGEFTAANIPTDNAPASNAARNAWVKAHSTVIIVNANTGAPLQ